MNNIPNPLPGPLPNPLAGLELAQIGWVVPDIRATANFLTATLGVSGFGEPQPFRAHDWGMTYYGQTVPGEWLISQAYTGGPFIELIQPVSGQSVFHDYLAKYPAGGIQHLAFQLPVNKFDELTTELRAQGYPIISELDHPIARITFFDTCQTLGLATEIIGVTPDGWAAIEQMKQGR